jgi:signal transduction histidine kinase
MGIPEDSIPHLFEKFYRVREHEGKATGTGLGFPFASRSYRDTTGASK